MPELLPITEALKKAFAHIPGVEKPAPTPRPRVVESWEPSYNPRTDATAVTRFGAEFLAPDRYQIPGTAHVIDANGALRDPEECIGCGTAPGGPDYRYMVKVLRPEHRFLPKPVYEWAWCTRCVTPEEREKNKAYADATPAPRAQKPAKAGRRLF